MKSGAKAKGWQERQRQGEDLGYFLVWDPEQYVDQPARLPAPQRYAYAPQHEEQV